MLHTLRCLLGWLNPQERRNALILLGVILLAGFLETLGVGSVMPFMMILLDPSIIVSHPALAGLQPWLERGETRQLQLLLGGVAFLLLALSVGSRALVNYLILRFTMMRECGLSTRLLRDYFSQPYVWFLGQNSAHLTKTLLTEVRLVVEQGMNQVLLIVSGGVLTCLLLGMLLWVNPTLTLLAACSIGGYYGISLLATRRALDRSARDRFLANEGRFRVISEAVGGFKEVKVLGLEKLYVSRFEEKARSFAQRYLDVQIIAQTPRYILEALLIGGALGAAVYLVLALPSPAQSIGTISLFAFAGYRLIPAVQQIFAGISTLRFVRPSLLDLESQREGMLPAINSTGHQAPDEVAFQGEIVLKKITFTYPKAATPALRDLTLGIPAYSTVGIIGSTGSGKTTAIDILLGLLEPEQGCVEVDGIPIRGARAAAWRRGIGYVPQHIYLADDTVAANIAFGIPPEQVNREALKAASQKANLHKFITTGLAQGYDTFVGERGVRLSGGQRQRIGIARALYSQPKLLVFDEATSALDNLSEAAVMEAVMNLRKDLTIVMIAHRLTTLKDCDLVYVIEQGQLVDHGSYPEVSGRNLQFSKITKKCSDVKLPLST